MAGVTLQFDSPYGTLLKSHVSANLDLLAPNGFALGTDTDHIINNSTGGKIFIDMDLIIGSCIPSGDAHVSAYLLNSMNGIDFEDPPSAVAPPPGVQTYPFPIHVTGSGATKLSIRRGILIPPGYAKILVGNFMNTAFPNGGNSLTYWKSTYSFTAS